MGSVDKSEEGVIGIMGGSVLGTGKTFCKIKLPRRLGSKGKDISLGRMQDGACVYFLTEGERNVLPS